ncbi:MAG: class I SAM-dependent methyltransferase [Symploca sp. SIO3C6]|nr:class I SAM-dependent methyltransferase [Symploca sp. SIO3C6]
MSFDYNRVAWVNHKYCSQPYGEQVMPTVKQLLLEHLPKSSNILDLCCGVGRITQRLLTEGYEVTGLDISEEMLRYARENSPNAEFILADARFFELPPIFHGVISTGALNHVMHLEELTCVFRNVYAALQPQGMFVFNLDLDDGFYSDWNNSSYSVVKDDCAWIVQQNYNPQEKILEMKITGFEQVEETWKRLDTIMLSKNYSSLEIKSALTSAGFRDVTIHEGEQNSEHNMHNYFFSSYK